MSRTARHTASRRTTLGTWGLRAASLLLSTLLALVIVEYGWRLVKFRHFTIEAGIDHPHFHHRLKPNQAYHYSSREFDVVIHTNRYGLRGRDPVIPKPPGVVRILVLGDSFVFGFPVRDEETFCARLEAGLQADGYPVEVINGGVSGYSPTLEYLSLRDEFLAFEPDLVMLWYDLGDLQEDTWFQKNLLYDADGRILRCDPRYIHGRFARWEWITNHSVIAKYVNTKILRTLYYLRTLGLRELVQTKLRGERAKVAVARLMAAQKSKDLAGSDKFLLARESSTVELVEPYWELSATYLRMIRDVLAERRIPLLLANYPYGILVGPDQWAEGRTFWGFEKGKRYEATVVQTLLTDFSRQEHLPYLTTLEHFRAAAHEKLFYDWDGHMTPAGQRVWAEAVLTNDEFLKTVRRAAERAR